MSFHKVNDLKNGNSTDSIVGFGLAEDADFSVKIKGGAADGDLFTGLVITNSDGVNYGADLNQAIKDNQTPGKKLNIKFKMSLDGTKKYRVLSEDDEEESFDAEIKLEENKSWIGKCGFVTVQINGLTPPSLAEYLFSDESVLGTEASSTEELETASCELVAAECKSCLEVDKIPSIVIGQGDFVTDMREYTPKRIIGTDEDPDNGICAYQFNPILDEEEENGEGEGEGEGSGEEGSGEEGSGEGVGEETEEQPQEKIPEFEIELSFGLFVDITRSKLIAKPNNFIRASFQSEPEFYKAASETQYVWDGFYVQKDSVEIVYEFRDAMGTGDLYLSGNNYTYGFVTYPINLSDVRNKADKQYSDLKFKMLYLELSGNTTSGPSIKNGVGAKYCPGSVQAILPNTKPKYNGDVYDRYYKVEVETKVSPKRVEESYFSALGYFMFGEAATRNSIKSEPTSAQWRNLISSSSAPTDSLPQSMVDGFNTIVENQLKLDSDYFVNVLSKLQQFLTMIQDELKSSLDMDYLKSLCNFKYSTNVRFNAAAHEEDTSKWKDGSKGLFGWHHDKEEYTQCRDTFNNTIFNEFFTDYSKIEVASNIDVASTLYGLILKADVTESTITTERNNALIDFWNILNGGTAQFSNHAISDGKDFITQVFGEVQNRVRFINTIDTQMAGSVKKVVFADDYCHVFTQMQRGDEESVRWYKFDSSSLNMSMLLDDKRIQLGDYEYLPSQIMTKFKILPLGRTNDWIFKMGNRDFSNNGGISDAIFVHCIDLDDDKDMWYLPNIDTYFKSTTQDQIIDMAYEENCNHLYVIFNGDRHVYRYDDVENLKDSMGRVVLQKELCTLKIVTKYQTAIDIGGRNSLSSVFIDYTGDSKTWKVKLYGSVGNAHINEVWDGSPGLNDYLFKKYNVIIFGDTLFNEDQLKFQNISKNKDMFEMLDVNEVDRCYYGLFRNDSKKMLNKNLGYDTYTVFKSAPDGGVVQRLPYEIVVPSLYRTKDDLFSLYSIVQVPVGKKEDGTDKYRIKLQELSVPDAPIYTHKDIDVQGIMDEAGVEIDDDLTVTGAVLSDFIPGDGNSTFFILSNKGFHKIVCKQRMQQVSIDTLDALKKNLAVSLYYSVLSKHLIEKHNGEDYFLDVSSKMNQYDEGFSVFNLIPAEFGATQDVGVIPDQPIDDTDTGDDHRADSVQVSTDVLQVSGMVVDAKSNPGFITAAVQNPSTSYDNLTKIVHVKRNPSLKGSGFFDYIYDINGNVLMDLYSIPFIYRINSNNTYDLYINVPTTRTKYLNRIAGTLRSDNTTQVEADDVRKRVNFENKSLPNNLDESITKLRVYIDRKYISIGNVELVEISGNSIPLDIYRDTVNDGFYDSIALASRWNGEVNELSEPTKDINKVMLEFECYGTDSQSIHISGKTLINHVLDEKRYKFG